MPASFLLSWAAAFSASAVLATVSGAGAAALSAPAVPAGLPPEGMASSQNTPDSLLREHLWRELTALPKGQRPAVGLVLSAGATRGVAHVGVIQVLEDAGFPIDVVSGTSMGAVIGAFYASGVSLPKLWEIRDRINLSSGSNYTKVRLLQLLLTNSLLSSKQTENLIRDQVGDIHFHQTIKPFACVAMDLKTGEKITFREGPLAPAVRASMNLPGIFAPVEYRHRYLVDGGVVDYIPVDAAKLLGAEWTLASVTESDFTTVEPDNVVGALEQVIDIRGALLSREQRKLANVVIEPPVGDIEFYETARAREAMDKGVIAAREKLRAAQESYILFSLPRLWPRWAGLEPRRD